MHEVEIRKLACVGPIKLKDLQKTMIKPGKCWIKMNRNKLKWDILFNLDNYELIQFKLIGYKIL